MLDFQQNVALVVSSCDKYEDAWLPYFELVKKFWPQHPKRIYLITETKHFHSDGLDITVCNYDKHLTWSQRLYKTLEGIDADYIIFSLEDFFLLDYVKHERIEECLCWMNDNSDIAVCRLFSSNHPKLKKTEKYNDFYVADNTVGYRLETQAALWNRKTLMSFIDLSEDAWQFESRGTVRIKDTEKVFLWHKSDNMDSINDKIFPYMMNPTYGYGIAWGHWLWNNKKWFKQNGIKKVKYRLGVLSKNTVNLRIKYLYNSKSPRVLNFIKIFWRFIAKLRKGIANIRIYGLKTGIQVSLKH